MGFLLPSAGMVGSFFQVVMIDLALAGDNAVAVGVAAAGLPQHQRRRAIVLGMLRLERKLDAGAIARLADGGRFAPHPLAADEQARLTDANLGEAPPRLRDATEASMCARSIARSGLTYSGLIALVAMLVASVGVRRIAAAPADIVVYAADVTAWQGNWTRTSESTAAGGWMMTSADYGWSTVDRPLRSPDHNFEATIAADANTNYHVWLRLRAA